MAERFELSNKVYEFTRVGVKIVGKSSQKDWELLGEGLKAVDEARQWAIGDWICDGKKHYGDGLYKRAAELTGLDEGTLRQFASIAGQYELYARTYKLPWRHHLETSSLKPIITQKDGTLAIGDKPDKEKIADLLGKAEKNSWSVKQLRDEVKQHKERQREQIRLANEPEKYSVIYADPPWQYTSGDQHTDEAQDTVLSSHYASMPLDDICDLPVKQMAATDCVLWMWTTSPTLNESLDVVISWGFNYKACMVWDKVLHNVGNYVSVRHELLLICTRGQPPKVPKLVDSVYVEERTEHSRKPGYFRDLIDQLYPNGRRIELFARGPATDTWDVWGEEAGS